jgi:hypothetical protein
MDTFATEERVAPLLTDGPFRVAELSGKTDFAIPGPWLRVLPPPLDIGALLRTLREEPSATRVR